MGHDRLSIGVEVGTPGYVQPGYVQPGYPQQGYGQQGYGQRIDPLRQEAFHVAEELRAGAVPQALQEIRNEVYSLPPREAERFSRELQQATGNRSPLQERPEVVPTAYGPRATGNQVLVLHDPYRGGEEVLKQVRREPIMPVVPGVGIGIGINLNHRR